MLCKSDSTEVWRQAHQCVHQSHCTKLKQHPSTTVSFPLEPRNENPERTVTGRPILLGYHTVRKASGGEWALRGAGPSNPCQEGSRDSPGALEPVGTPFPLEAGRWTSPGLSHFFKLQNVIFLILRGMPSGQSPFLLTLNSKATYKKHPLRVYKRWLSVSVLYTVVLFIFFFPHTPIQICSTHKIKMVNLLSTYYLPCTVLSPLAGTSFNPQKTRNRGTITRPFHREKK